MNEPSSRGPGIAARVIGWLRAGYPDGVPPQDYRALLGILRRSLTPEEVTQVVSQLSDEAAAGRTVVTRADVERQISEILLGPAMDEDVVRVSGHLASAGWPLGTADLGAEAPAGERGGLVARVVGWLRAGYPTGLPDGDFVPLVALLRRRLTDAEVAQVGVLLEREGVRSPSRVDVGTAIAQVTAELPSDADVERVRVYLSEHGWPVDFPV